MTDRIDIGIDGGGTGCRVLISHAGREAQAKGGPANIVSDAQGAQAAIVGAVHAALDQLQLPVEALQDARIVAGLAGCRLPASADAFAIALPFLAHVVDDSVTALEGAFGGNHGTLVNLGTGSFFIRHDTRGITHQGGWGLILGDEGSAAWLGRLALSQMLQIEDGSLPAFRDDPLIEALRLACGTHPVLFAQKARPQDFAALTPVIAAQSSPWAQALSTAVIAQLSAGLKAVGHPTGSPWVLTGGLGKALANRLVAPLADGLQEAKGSALDGALSMARALP